VGGSGGLRPPEAEADLHILKFDNAFLLTLGKTTTGKVSLHLFTNDANASTLIGKCIPL